MKYEKYDVKNDASEAYAALYLYLMDDSPDFLIKSRPLILVCPGGGYEFTSDREAEIVAVQFLSMGYHAAVLRYSVAPARYPTALLELGRSVALIRKKAKEWHVDPHKIVICGFSAGGHLAANYGMFWNQNFIAEDLQTDTDLLQPDALILCYPVITSGEYAHEDSFRALLGEEYETKKDELSLENCVGPQVPRTFIWHTWEDQLVPVQNSLLLAQALTEQHIPVELHIFEKGEHGLSLGNNLTAKDESDRKDTEVSVWPQLVHTWMENWNQ